MEEDEDSWAIIIFPEFILIDNCHSYPHIHINDENRKISINNSCKVFLKVKLHIESESEVNLNKLLMELR